VELSQLRQLKYVYNMSDQLDLGARWKDPDEEVPMWGKSAFELKDSYVETTSLAGGTIVLVIPKKVLSFSDHQQRQLATFLAREMGQSEMQVIQDIRSQIGHSIQCWGKLRLHDFEMIHASDVVARNLVDGGRDMTFVQVCLPLVNCGCRAE
jgi:hypothetical protein